MQVGPITFFVTNKCLSRTFTRAGSINKVPTPAVSSIKASSVPTVLYGVNGARSNRKKPTAITIMFRVIALAGSAKTTGAVFFHEPRDEYILLPRTKKCMAKSTANPNVIELSIATGIS